MADTINYDKLSEAIARAIKGGGGFRAGGDNTGGGSGSINLEKFGESVKENLKTGTDGFVESAKTSISTFQGLSKTGANFSNDIIGMSVAAAQSRLSLGDFANVIANNGKNMAGLGGSVTRGAEAFGKLSKSFFDSNAGNELQQMGYTAKEVNEVLALQASTSRYTMSVEGTAGAKSREAAASLAKEMDAIAKLTGKSKEEQMEAAKKRATDGQIEAKLRLIGIEQGAEAEKAAREGFQKQMAAAEARGMGQMAKEMFATGTVTSEEAATQYALLGEAAQKTGEQMAHLAKGNLAAADAANKEAEAANAKNQRDPTLLRMAAMGDAAGSVGTILKKSTEDNMALHDSVMGLVKGNTNLLKSQDDYAKALATIRADIVASQDGRKKPGGEQVSGATQGVIAAQIATQNVKSGIAAAVETKNEKGESIAGSGRRLGAGLATVEEQLAGPGGNLSTKIERAARLGQNPQPEPAPTGNKIQDEANRQRGGSTADRTIGSIVAAASDVTNMTVTGTLKILGKTNIVANADGGYIKDPTLSTLAEKGPEFVLNEGQMRDTISAAGMSGVKNILGKLPPPDKDTDNTKLAPPSEKPAMSFAESMAASVRKGMQTVGAGNLNKEPSIDMAAISKDISTTISSVSGGNATTTRSVQNEESLAASKELAAVKEQYAAERETLLQKTKTQLGPDAGSRQIRNAMREGDEGKALEEKYSALRSSLEKKIEDGIKWEVSTKESALDDTKKIIADELAITQQGQAERLSELSAKEKLKLLGLTAGAEAESLARQKYQAERLSELSAEEKLKLLGLTAGAEAESLARQKYQDEAVAAVEKNSQKIAADIKGAIPIDTEFGDLDGAIKAQEEQANKAAAATKSTPAIDLNAINLPGFGAQMKANAASVPAAVNKPAEKQASPGKKINPETGEEYTPVAETKPKEEKPAQRGGKTAALEDVVKSLDMLNITMNKLLSQSDELGRKQISATEKNSKNMYS
jgi:hypothetical protein